MSTKPKRHGRTAFSEAAFFLVAFAGMIGSIIGADRLVGSGLVSQEVGFQIKEFTTLPFQGGIGRRSPSGSSHGSASSTRSVVASRIALTPVGRRCPMRNPPSG